MQRRLPKDDKDDFSRRGDAIYEKDIRPLVEAAHTDEIVAIDVKSGAFEIDPNEIAASDRLLARVPDAQIWLRRIGKPYLRRFGFHPRPVSS